ncbi:MAG: 5-(carboxyamino)imidazole ribonucleotide mutase [Planctomycetes bacterium]|nr:5-(carboxyamino)imidazole ribonucleotide mutase [Planctomycetota bacterium]
MAKKPKIGMVMGSDSDWPTMEETAKVLDEFGVDYDVDVISAHRTPDKAHEYAVNAEGSGYDVIIAGAGGAAHLAGVVASLTTLPVIGVPMLTTALGGVDSLYSTVQMPGGVPVASMGIGKSGAKNAGIFAVQILSTGYPALKKKLAKYKKDQAAAVAKKSKNLKQQLKKKTRR